MIAVFLIAYGITGLLGTLIGWDDHRRDMAGYLAETVGMGAGAAPPLLFIVKPVQLLLVLLVVTGLLRRRDVWILLALLGWVAGFAVVCVLDVWAGFIGRFAEHIFYLFMLTALSVVSYALSIKVRGGRPSRLKNDAGMIALQGLTRSRDMALETIERWRYRGGPQAPSSPERLSNDDDPDSRHTRV